jgi:hypothetical protein
MVRRPVPNDRVDELWNGWAVRCIARTPAGTCNHETEAEMTEVKTCKPDAVHPGWPPGYNACHVRLIGSSADLRERHGKLAIRTIAVFTLLIGIVPCQAGADDAIKFGRWEYSMTEPEVVQLPRSIHLFPKMTSMSTTCITATDPIGFPIDEPCKMDKIDLNGGTLRWSVICTKPPATTTLEWIEHYHGETMDGQVNNRTDWPDHLYEKRNSLQGRYLGPCAAK